VTNIMAERPEEMEAFFDRRSDSYDQHMRENVADFEGFYRAVVQPMPETDRPLEILDLGCGTGLELDDIFGKAPRARVTAVDLSRGMLARLEKKFPDRSDQIQTVLGSYLEMQFPEEHYDLTLSVMTLHHLLPEPKLQLYRRIYRTLKPGGRYVEGDYVVSAERMLELREAYQAWLDTAGETHAGQYHLDLPLTLPLQKELLLRAGFQTVQEHWVKEEAAVISAVKEDRQP